jgi:trimeric autotransporter adhesin
MAAVPTGNTVPITNDARIDSITMGASWTWAAGQPQVLTYSTHTVTSQTWTSNWNDMLDLAFQEWSAVADIRFDEVPGGVNPTTTPADMAIVFRGQLPNEPLVLAQGIFPDPAWPSLPWGPRSHGDIAIFEDSHTTSGLYFWDHLHKGSGALTTLMHEIGHTMGLKHPFHNTGGHPTSIAYNDEKWTIMSYTSSLAGNVWNQGHAITPMVNDILAIQHMYGANMNYRTDNDSYTLSVDGFARTIWDAGGTDTFDASGLNVGTGVDISLVAGTHTYHGTRSMTAIAYNVVIENAVGSAFDDSIIGNAAANVLFGGAGNDVLNGAAGADTMIGGSGNDIYGVDNASDVVTELAGGGTDQVQASIDYVLGTELENLTLVGTQNLNGTGNASANLIAGNIGNNVLSGGAGNDVLNGGDGDDTLDGQAGADTLNGENGNDLLFGGDDNDTLNGGAGNDQLAGHGGADTMAGGAGNDAYYIESTADVMTEAANEGLDTVVSSLTHTLGINFENLTLSGSANIDGTGNVVANILRGNSGNNILNGGAGLDQMLGGGGDDTYVVDAAGDVVTELAGEGTDTVSVSFAVVAAAPNHTIAANVENAIIAGTGAWNVVGNELNNVIVGNASNNILIGNAGTDTMTGGAGNDTYYVDNVGDVVTELAGEGADHVQSSIDYVLGAELENLTLTGTQNLNGTGNVLANSIAGNTGSNALSGDAGNDVLSGGDGDDLLFGGDDNDTLNGGAGNDQLAGHAGADTMAGGAGNDAYYVESTADVVIEAAGGGVDTVVSSLTFTLATNFENLTLSGSANIDGIGNAVTNVLRGNSGNNVLAGGGGIDHLYGGDGNDTLNGGVEADRMYGGAGDDVYYTSVGTDLVSEAAGEGTDTVYVSFAVVATAPNHTIAANVENAIIAGTGAWNVVGNELNNIIVGNASNNILIGNGGADTMTGGAGNDYYYVYEAGDVVNEAAGGGTLDRVYSSISYTLGAEVEQLALLDAANLNATGNALGNTLWGNAGNNVLDGMGGADAMHGGAGDDTYWVDAGDVVGEGVNAGTDTVNVTLSVTGATAVNYVLAANVENVNMLGTGLWNVTGNASNNEINGNESDNQINGGTGADSMAGGAGNDIYAVDHAIDRVIERAGEGTDLVIATMAAGSTYTLSFNVENLNLGGTVALHGTGNGLDNTINGNAAVNVLSGEAGNDALNGGGGIDHLYGGDGDDTLNGGVEADRMYGGAGDDVYYTSVGGDLVSEAAGEGTDTVYVYFAVVAAAPNFTIAANVENAIIAGTGAWNVVGNELNNVIVGNAYNNILVGNAGTDTMTGGLGNDVYYVDNVNDVVNEVAGGGTADGVNSTITYTLGAELENLALSGSDAIDGTGNALDNVISGNTANNVLNGMAGNDRMNGGAGNDTYWVDAGDVVGEGVNSGTDTVNVTLSVTGATAVNYVLATNVENVNMLGTGLWNVVGNASNNVIVGNASDNIINGMAGADTMIGGLGNDWYGVDSALDTITENAGEGTDLVTATMVAGSTYTLAVNLENLALGGTAATHGTGNALDNAITGNTGNNILRGEGGNDTLNGLAGIDQLMGGTGTDTMYGGAGADHFLFTQGFDADRIMDFVEEDRMHLDRALFTSFTAAGVLNAANFVRGTAAADANDFIIFDNATGFLYYDADGSGGGLQTQFGWITAGAGATLAMVDASDISIY